MSDSPPKDAPQEAGGQAPAPAPADEGCRDALFAKSLARMESAGPILAQQAAIFLAADAELIVRGGAGALHLLRADGDVFNRPLLEVAPGAAGVAERLGDVLAGSLSKAQIGLVPVESTLAQAAPGGRPAVLAHVVPLIESGVIVGLLYCAIGAPQTTALQERNERQRRELFELRQRLTQMQLDLALANSELRRLDDAKSQFVSAAAHELRNPLASLIGYIELFSEEDNTNLSTTQAQFLTNINRSAQRLRQLTNNLLDITRLDSNRLELVMTTMDAIDLIEMALADLQPLFDAKRQRVVVKAERLPAIWCDKARALQILTNLLSNAHKYTPEGGTITVQLSRQRGRPFIVFRIKDSGIGIPPDDQSRLFTRFYRASNATAADGTGAGLGLAITQSLVRLHGGKIWFESAVGKGTTFNVTLPVAS